VRLLLSGRAPGSLSPEERARVRKDTESPALIPFAVALQALGAAVNLLRVLRAFGLV
jgi:hypothetical protein